MKKKKQSSKVLPAILAVLLVIVIGGSVVLGVGFGVYGKDTSQWFKAKNNTEQVAPADETPGDQEQPGENEQPGGQETPGENEQPGTNDPVVDPEPQVEYAIKVGDVLNTIYFNTNAAPDFSKINFDEADIMLNVGSEEQPVLIPEVKLATLGTITVDDAEHELALMALRINAADMGESSDRIQYLIAVGFAGDLEMVNPIYSITNDGEGGWAMPSLNLVEFLELEDEEIIASALKVSALYHQDFWGDLIDAEAFDAFMPLDTLTALYFNTNTAPDFSKLDWSNAKSYQGMPVLPLITIKDGDREAAFVSVFKVTNMDERHIYMDEVYMIFVGEDLRTNGWVYASEDVFSEGIVGWVKQLVKFDDKGKDIYKVYNIEFLKSFASKEPFADVEYPVEEEVEEHDIKAGATLNILYFNQNVTPDFSLIDWNIDVNEKNGVYTKQLISDENGNGILTVAKFEYDLNDGNGIQSTYALLIGGEDAEHLNNAEYVIYDSSNGFVVGSKDLTTYEDFGTTVGTVNDIDFIESFISINPIA